jgi:Co/Zn/Cd efflux system component
MKAKKTPFRPKTLLWWVAAIALALSAALFFFLKQQAQYDAALDERRMFIPVVGIIIAGICIIAGTAERWFYPK